MNNITRILITSLIYVFLSLTIASFVNWDWKYYYISEWTPSARIGFLFLYAIFYVFCYWLETRPEREGGKAQKKDVFEYEGIHYSDRTLIGIGFQALGEENQKEYSDDIAWHSADEVRDLLRARLAWKNH